MTTGLHVVQSIAGLRPEHGPLFAVVGVFDGLHRGHRYLLEHLEAEALRRDALPAVITFDSHPDEVLKGAAPPLLLDPDERLRLLGEAGVRVAVVQHFDAALRTTPYDVFVGWITERVRLVGLLMTPDAAFGHERRGTPEALAALGVASDPPWEVVVVPPFTLDGRPVSSSEIRRLVAAGDLDGAARLLGRPYEVTGVTDGGEARLVFPVPVALPPPGRYDVLVADTGGGRGTAAAADVQAAPPAVEVLGGSVPVPRARVVFR